VTGIARAVPVLLAACTGMDREFISSVVEFWYSWFWHCVTIRTGNNTIFTHMRINHLNYRILTEGGEGYHPQYQSHFNTREKAHLHP
jgi:hypothetical protein